MAGKGPLPKPNAVRRRRSAPTNAGFKLLPHEGRAGDPPAWPLDHAATDVELRMWTRLWMLPQAVEWERMRCEDVVALYVRTFCAAAMPGAQTDLLTAARLLDDKIGVSPKAMMSLRWETDEPIDNADEPAPAPYAERTYVPKKEAS